MSIQQLLHVGNESSLIRRLVCPRQTRHSQRVAQVLGRHLAKSALTTRSSQINWGATVSIGASTKAASNLGPTTADPGHGLVGTLPFHEEDYVEVGLVLGAHGVRGELRLELSTDQPSKRFKAGNKLYLLPPSGQAQGVPGRSSDDGLPLIAVTSRGFKARPAGKGTDTWILALADVTTMTQAELLRGHVLYCAASDRDALRDPDEFYVTDIIGCTVIDKASRLMLGLVVDVYSGMGTHDTLRVKLRANEEDIRQSRIRYCMIPFAKAICPVLDLASRTLEVAPPEGLMDLVTVERLRKPLSKEAIAAKLAQLRELQAKEALLPPSPVKADDSDDDEDDGEDEQAAVASASARTGRPSTTAGTAKRSTAPRLGRVRDSSGSRSTNGDSEGDERPAGTSDGAGQEADEGEEGEETQQGGGLKRRRPGLRRRPGSLRLGRRRE